MADATNTGPSANREARAADETDGPPPLTIPLSATGVGSEAFWQEQITEATKRRKKEAPLWKMNLARYRGQRPKLPGLAPADSINVNVDFYNAEQKKAQLFYQQPDVQLAPKNNQPPETVALFRDVLNYYLGKDEIDVEDLMDELLTDLLVPAGIGATKIGFEEVRAQVTVPSGALDPTTHQPAIDPATGQPATTTVPRRIYSRYFWERISPSKMLIPAQWTSSRYERAPWLGFEFTLDTELMGREFRVGSRFIGEAPEEDSLVSENDKEFRHASGKGWEIWYRASAYDPREQNPEKFRRLVIIESQRSKRVVLHEDSPYQKFGPNGEFLEGLRGNPIHLLTLRNLTDTAYPPSDCSVSRNQVDELSAGRSQMIIQRRRNLPMRGVNTLLMGKTDIDKLERGEIQGILPVDGDPDQAVKSIGSTQLPRENFGFNEVIQQDIDRLWALGSNQQSTAASAGRTATEMSLIQRATDTRMTKERNRVLAWYVKGVEKLSALLQLFGDQAEFLPIVGQDGTQNLLQWDKTKVAGRFVFTIRPDSSVRTDAADEIERGLRAYNLMARDNHINRGELVKPLLVKMGYDPAKVWVEQLPPQPPEPPKPSVSFKAEDLTLPPVIEYLKQFGITITPAVPPPSAALSPGLTPPGRAPQLPHPGAANRQPLVDQHEANLTGQPAGAPPLH